MSTAPQLTAAVLAGGRGLRMGREKATIVVAGERLVDRAVALAGQVLDHVVVLRGEPRGPRIPDLTVPQLPDRWPGCGALGGVHAAIDAARGDGALVIACDMPLLEAAFLARMVEQLGDADALVPRSTSGLQPLCAIYRRSCLPAIEARLRDGQRQVMSFHADVDTRELVVDDDPTWRGREDLFTNVNTPAELARAEGVLAGRVVG